MSDLKIRDLGITELTFDETVKVNGGSEFSEAIFRGLGYLCYKIATINWGDISIDFIS